MRLDELCFEIRLDEQRERDCLDGEHVLCPGVFILEMLEHLNAYLFCHSITIITKKCKKNKKNVGRNGEEALKETIEFILIRPPQITIFRR